MDKHSDSENDDQVKNEEVETPKGLHTQSFWWQVWQSALRLAGRLSAVR